MGSAGRARRAARRLARTWRGGRSGGHLWARLPTGPGPSAPLDRLDLGDGEATMNQRQLARHGLAGWQPATSAALLSAFELSPQPGAFFDVGANGGVYSLLCRRLFPAWVVVAFEPTPATRAAARRWAELNHVEYALEPWAVGDEETTATLYLSAQSDASNSLMPGFRRHRGSVVVDVVTLDGYVRRSGVVPTVVKIDVEMYEPSVLRGGQQLFQVRRPAVVVEILPSSTGVPADQPTWQLLTGWGYHGRQLNDRDWLFWPDALPDAFEERFSAWQAALARCLPPSATDPAVLTR